MGESDPSTASITTPDFLVIHVDPDSMVAIALLEFGAQVLQVDDQQTVDSSTTFKDNSLIVSLPR